MTDSCRHPLWAAAYLVNGGYFRGWLIMQVRAVYERVVADPDALADIAAIWAKAPKGRLVECEDTLYIASQAYRATTGRELPGRVFRIEYPEPQMYGGWCTGGYSPGQRSPQRAANTWSPQRAANTS